MISLLQTVAKPVIDTITKQAQIAKKPVNETLEILSKVNEFYDSSWDKLLYVLSGAFAVLAIAVPVVIQYIQNKTIKASEKELENKIIDEIDKARNEIKKELTITLDKKIKEYDVKLKKTNDELSGMIMHINGINYLQGKHFSLAFQSFIFSLGYNIDGDIKNRLKLDLENILCALEEIDQEIIEDLREKKFYGLEDNLNKVIKLGDNETIELIMSIKDKLKNSHN